MSRIRILSEHLANQIAAGEVVERPASVVKELVENSLDAGASRVDIHVEGSGLGLLRVADNGLGMDGDDVLLCIERHATSKLRDDSELAAIATLGFRGEAIPSIASVAWMTILSRPEAQDLGTRAELRYGTLQAIHPDGCGRGTMVEVRHLFGNMPVRRKFLKSARTELHHIEEVVRSQALAHPEVGFTLLADGRVVLDYPPASDLERRVRDVFRYRGGLLPLAAGADDDPDQPILDGFLLLPDAVAATKARLRTLVNNRPVQDAMLRHAVLEGLQGYLMKGYQPAGALLLTIAPDQVDVNVHPAKREIRFRRSEAVHRFVVERVRGAMGGHQQALRTSLFALPPDRSAAVTDARPPTGAVQAAAFPAGLRLGEPLPSTARSWSSGMAAPAAAPIPLPSLPSATMPVVEPTPSSARPEVEGGIGQFAGLTLIGQLFSLYLLCERNGQLVVIDQHAAHERLLYGQLREGYLGAQIPRQTLLFPVTVELTPAQADTFERRAVEVEALGLQAEPFGETTWVIKAVPALVSQVEPGMLLREVLDRLRGPIAGGDRPVPQAVDELLASMACKAAIKAGYRLQPVEMLKLLERMEASAVFSHCPHGRPVVKTFSVQEVERWFHRHGG